MKANVLVKTNEIDRHEWLDYRRQGIGGSDVAAICGVSRWNDPLGVWMDKTGRIEASEPNEAMYWGNVLEDTVRKEFVKRSGLKVRRVHSILQHPEVPYLLANVDGIIKTPEGEGIFEAKTTNAFNKGEWSGDGLPDQYLLQVQHYLMVTGYNFAYVAVLVGGNEFIYKRIEADEEMIDLIRRLEVDFWENYVMKDVPPEPTAQSCQLLSKLYPGGKQEALILPEDSLELVKRFEMYQKQEKEAKSLKEEAANQLKALMQDHEIAKVDGYTINWKSVTSERLDTKAFKMTHPDLAKNYLQESISRRFSVKSK